MFRYALKRLLWMIPIILCVTVLIFTIMYFTPGDPAIMILGTNATQVEIDELRETMGLNDPYLTQLGRFLHDTFIEFDLGQSYHTKVSVSSALLDKLPRTLVLAVMCMLISLIVGVTLGIVAAVNQNKLPDRVSMIIALLGVSVPNFWLALLLVLLFSVKLNMLPAMGVGGIEYYILPAIAGSVGGIAAQARQTRSSMLEVIRSDFVITARAKGVKEWKVILQHALPNALLPIITLSGTQFGALLGGTLILETIFSIPGVGSYIITAVNNRDLPVVRGGVVFLGITFSLCMLVVDLIYAAVDPRIKAQYTNKARRKKHVK